MSDSNPRPGSLGTITLSAKCSDMCNVMWPDGSHSDGYAPGIPGLCGGDYIDLSVDVATGIIIGWDVARALQASESDV